MANSSRFGEVTPDLARRGIFNLGDYVLTALLKTRAAAEVIQVVHLFAEADEMAPAEFPRLVARYATPSLPAVWFPPTGSLGLGNSTKKTAVHITELSLSGLRLEVPAKKKLKVGLRVRLEFNDTECLVEVRNLRAHPTKPKLQIIGASYSRPSDEFDQLVGSIIQRLRSLEPA